MSINRTNGELVMVTPAASQAVCSAFDVSARNLLDAYATLKRKIEPLRSTWGPSSTGTACFAAFDQIGKDLSALCDRIAQTSKTIADNTAQGLALDGQLGNLFT